MSSSDFSSSDESPVEKKSSKPKARAVKKPIMLDDSDESFDYKSKKKADTSFSEDEKPSKASKAKPKAKMSKAKVSESDDEEREEDTPVKSKSKSKLESGTNKSQTATEKYQKLTDLEHVLKRPDMYVGTISRQEEEMWVWNGSESRMEKRKVGFVPGLLKIFDEILVNAADNYVRSANDPKNKMTLLKVTINAEEGFVSVWNNGPGIPVVMHELEKKPIPELLFGDLRTGENFKDDVKKTWGGRNGYGAKLTNIYSSKFVVHLSDGEKVFKQTFSSNLHERTKPKVVDDSKRTSFTQIDFYPDLKRFGMDSLDQDICALFEKRVYDISGTCQGLKVTLNGKVVPVKKFEKYVELFKNELEKGLTRPTKIVYEQVNPRWEIAVHASDGFNQISFVNNVATWRGGTHVNAALDQLVKAINAEIEKKNKGGVKLKTNQVREHFTVYVNCLIENPSFDNQSKEFMNSKKSDWGSKFILSSDFLKKVTSNTVGIVEEVLNFAKAKQHKLQATKLVGSKKLRVSGIAKLDDANKAGSSAARDCTLILTEGDSAKALATAGLSVVGRDYYGIFPLRGKVLNVRDAKHTQIMGNEEIKNLLKVMGLSVGKKYDSVNSLRYGHIMIMTDQDYDGSHIKGLLINLIHHFWPSLLRISGFLQEFITPIVKAKKGKKFVDFYTLPEFEKWRETAGDTKGWNIKYYKGLATTDANEAKTYFKNIARHKIEFRYSGESDDKSIDLVFNKNKADERKEWLTNFVPGTFLDQNVSKVTYADFVNKEMILFSLDDCARSIPSAVDGLKPSQRKIMFGCFKRSLVKDIKVAQLAGYISEHAAYHHGEVSLQHTIVGLAQNFVGSNNINLLVPSGMFGTRILGGKDAGAARYIFTRLTRIARKIYRAEDDAILTYLNDDGQSVEPKWYLPVLPMILVNGSTGIGTGWSSNVPCYDPRDLANNIRLLMKGREQQPLKPWYRGFRGTLEADPSKASSYYVRGNYEQIDERTYRVTELPIGVWTEPFKAKVEELLEKEIVKDYQDHHTDTTVDFTIVFASATSNAEFEKHFKMHKKLSVSNMHLFDRKGRIHKYASPEEILEEFYKHRLKYYDKRKAKLVDELARQLRILDNKVRFIVAVVSREIVVSNRKRADIEKELEEKKFDKFDATGTQLKRAIGAIDEAQDDHEEDEENETEANESGSESENGEEAKKRKRTKKKKSHYDYLLSMSLWNLTMEKVAKMKKERDSKETELQALVDTTIQTLWERDLDQVLVEFEALEKDLDKRANQDAQSAARGAGKKPPKKRKESSDGSESEEFARPSKPKPAKAAPSKSVSAKPKASAPSAAAAASAKPSVSPPKMKQSTLSFAARQKISLSSSLSEIESFGSPVAPKPASSKAAKASAPKAPAKVASKTEKPAAKSIFDDLSLDSDNERFAVAKLSLSDSSDAPAAKAKPKAKAATKAAAKSATKAGAKAQKRKKASSSPLSSLSEAETPKPVGKLALDSSSSEEKPKANPAKKQRVRKLENSSSSDNTPPATLEPRGARGARAKAVKYIESDGSDGSDGSDESVEAASPLSSLSSSE